VGVRGVGGDEHALGARFVPWWNDRTRATVRKTDFYRVEDATSHERSTAFAPAVILVRTDINEIGSRCPPCRRRSFGR